jgi:hypothetical protein
MTMCVVPSRQALFSCSTTAPTPALAFEACVPKDWRTGAGLIEPYAAEHERIGGRTRSHRAHAARRSHFLERVVLQVGGHLPVPRAGRVARIPEVDLRVDDQHVLSFIRSACLPQGSTTEDRSSASPGSRDASLTVEVLMDANARVT